MISSASKLDGKLHHNCVGVTIAVLKMVDDTDNKKELEIPRTEPLLRQSGI